MRMLVHNRCEQLGNFLPTLTGAEQNHRFTRVVIHCA